MKDLGDENGVFNGTRVYCYRDDIIFDKNKGLSGTNTAQPERSFELEDLVNKQVFDPQARSVGKVIGVSLGEAGTWSLVLANENRKLNVRADEVSQISDIVLLKTRIEDILARESLAVEFSIPHDQSSSHANRASITICRNCGAQNPLDSKFCGECGKGIG